MFIQPTINFRNYNNYQPIYYNTFKKYSTAPVLIAGDTVNISFKGAIELMEAAEEDNLEAFIKEVKKGVNPVTKHQIDGWKELAQVKAAQNDARDVTDYLFSLKGFTPNAADDDGNDGLCAAIENGNDYIAEMYINHPKINKKTLNYGLLAAYNAGRLDYFKMILEHPKTDPSGEPIGELLSNVYQDADDDEDKIVYLQALLEDPRTKWDIYPFNLLSSFRARMMELDQREEELQQREEDLQDDKDLWEEKHEELDTLLTKQKALAEETKKEVRKAETKKIREEERQRAEDGIAKQKEDLDNQRKALNEEKKAVKKEKETYQGYIAQIDDLVNEEVALQQNGFATFFGITTKELPKKLPFADQIIWVLGILGSRQDKLTSTTYDVPEDITRALQDKNGDISIFGLDFLEKILDVSKRQCSKKDLIAAINAIKTKNGFDMRKAAHIKAYLSFGKPTMQGALKMAEKYAAKPI